MKLFGTAFALFVTLIATAQTDQEVNIDQFNTIKTFDLIKVKMVKSDVNKLEIKGKDGSEVEYVFKNGLLKLRMETDKIFDGAQTFVTVYYTDVKTIDANEGSVIYADDISGQDQVEIRVQEGAKVIAGININRVEVRAVTGGIVEISGKVIKQEVTVNTGGIVEGKNLKSENADVKVQAGGEVELYASKSVDAIVRAGGYVTVYGNPENVNKKTTFGGRIVIK
ncbi:head GIN domain-containing protein [Nonlabens antarcticus]|uniref:head GIN domain-containing protein n=1 Tax=Nonlabens antarcticus TaxID=392714 RepID=UPI001891E7DD|nr:head GIN domain-containing protein [Nonlabens antarcticus]